MCFEQGKLQKKTKKFYIYQTKTQSNNRKGLYSLINESILLFKNEFTILCNVYICYSKPITSIPILSLQTQINTQRYVTIVIILHNWHQIAIIVLTHNYT